MKLPLNAITLIAIFGLTATTPGPVPYTFEPNTPAYSAQVNADFNTLYTFLNNPNIDNTNIGSAGIYASQIIPLTTSEATFGGSIPMVFPNGATFSVPVTGGGVSPVYNAAGSPLASTAHSVRLTGVTSSTVTTCGPFVGSFCSTITLPTGVPFAYVTGGATPTTSFDCGGGESQAANGYWLHDFGTFAVEWNSLTTLYVESPVASDDYAFTCGGF